MIHKYEITKYFEVYSFDFEVMCFALNERFKVVYFSLLEGNNRIQKKIKKIQKLLIKIFCPNPCLTDQYKINHFILSDCFIITEAQIFAFSRWVFVSIKPEFTWINITFHIHRNIHRLLWPFWDMHPPSTSRCQEQLLFLLK